MVNDNIVWASGSGGTVAKSTDGGNTWQWLIVKDYEKMDFRDIEAFDSNTAIIMGIEKPAVILKTINGGKNWYKVFEDTTKGMFLDAMSFADDETGMVIGDPVSNKPFIAMTFDQGESWIDPVKGDTSKLPTLFSNEAFFASSGTNIFIKKNNTNKLIGGFASSGKLQILETERVKIPHRQSKLHLYLHNEFLYSANDYKIANLIEQECKKGKKIQVLSFSETLATSIATPEKLPNGDKVYSSIGKVLKKQFGEINLCVGGKDNNPYASDKCNVGTTFKTGISIEEENVSLFIITPHPASYNDEYGRNFGIFTDGMNTIIQAFARIRNNINTDIFVIMPSPKVLIKNSPEYLGGQNYLSILSNIPIKEEMATDKKKEWKTFL